MIQRIALSVFKRTVGAIFLLTWLSFLGTTLLTPARAGQMEARTFGLLRIGMSESEVFSRAGQPDFDTRIGLESVARETFIVLDDSDTVVGAVRKKQVATVKELHYVPGLGEHDPHLTVVTIKAGKISGLNRTKLFTRRTTELPAVADVSSERISDYDYRIRQLDRTIAAARQLAETRARLKAAAGDAKPTKTFEIYSAIQPDGSIYFGDRPP